MNRMDEQLDRLFRAAGYPVQDAFPPYGLETRVMAAWRAREPFSFWTPAVLIRGLMVAGLIATISLLSLITQSPDPYTDYQQLADLTVQSASVP